MLEIKSERFSSYWSETLSRTLGKWLAGLSDVRVRRGRGRGRKRQSRAERWEGKVDTWMGLVSLYSPTACDGISSRFSHSTSHHTTEDLAAEIKHSFDAALRLPLLDSRVRKIPSAFWKPICNALWPITMDLKASLCLSWSGSCLLGSLIHLVVEGHWAEGEHFEGQYV